MRMQCAYDCGLSECDHPKIETKPYPYAKLSDPQSDASGDAE